MQASRLCQEALAGRLAGREFFGIIYPQPLQSQCLGNPSYSCSQLHPLAHPTDPTLIPRLLPRAFCPLSRPFSLTLLLFRLPPLPYFPLPKRLPTSARSVGRSAGWLTVGTVAQWPASTESPRPFLGFATTSAGWGRKNFTPVAAAGCLLLTPFALPRR